MEETSLIIGEKIAEVPIVQGGMGVGISLGNLAGTVAKEGGIGIISAAQIGYLDPEFENDPIKANLKAIVTQFEKARKISPEGIIGFNIMVALQGYETYVKAAAKAGADLIISGAGLPTELPKYMEGYTTKIAPIVSTKKSASVILKFWDRKYNRTADMIVIEGPKAGGHLGFTSEQVDLYNQEAYNAEIKEILEVVKLYEEKFDTRIPVVLAGGISSKKDLEDAWMLGAQGVQVGSRFVTTKECDASTNYKQAYLNAKEEDIVLVKSPVGMPGRAILNPFIKKVISQKRIVPEKCYRCLRTCDITTIPYCITKALINAAKGNTDEGLIFCGADGYKATKIETVKEVIDSFMS